MRILLISQHYWPEIFRINEVVESLLNKGCQVTVLAGQPNYPQGKIYPGYRACGFCKEQHPAGYTIYRVAVVPRGRGNALRLAANYVSFVVTATLVGPWLLRGQKFDAVFVYCISPILQGIPASLLKILKRAPLIIWVQDLWPQSLEVTGFIKSKALLSIVGVITRWIYRRADLLLVQSRAFIPPVERMAGAVPVRYQPNPGDSVFNKIVSDDSPVFKLRPAFNVVFAGNLGTAQAVETILDAAEIIANIPDLRIVLIGEGSRREWLQHQVLQRHLSNVELPGSFPSDAMPSILSQASALLVTLKRGEALSKTIPSKIPTYLAAGRPIVASLDGEGARIVEEAGAGITCAAENASALAAAILTLKATSGDALAQMGRAGRAYFDRHLDPTVLADELLSNIASAQLSRNHGLNKEIS